AVAATELEFGDAGGHVEFVLGHQHGVDRDAEEIRQRRHGLAAAVHVGGWDEQTNVAALMAELAHQAKILFVEGEADALAVGQALNEKGPCVVPGLVVFGAWITQADDQLDGSHVRGPFTGRGGRVLLGAFFLHARSVDVGDCQVVAVGQGHQLDAFRQLEVGQVNDLTDFDFRQVDFDEFRQVLRLAGNFDFGDGVGHFAALLLHTNGGGFVDEVQRNVGVQLLAGNDANEVSVQNEAFGRMALQSLDHYAFGGAGNVQGQHVAEG